MQIRRPTRAVGEDLRDLPTYSIPEAATFLAIPRRTLSEWFSTRDRLFTPAGDYLRCSLLSFKDIVQVYMVHVLRHYHQFSSHELREAFRNLRIETNSRYPLFDHDISVFADCLLLEKPARGRRGRQTIDLSHNRQLALSGVTDVFSKRILHDRTGKPIEMFPWRDFATDSRSRPVSIHPDVLSGQLVVTGTRVPVAALRGMKQAGKTSTQIADVYGLDVETVKKAIRHVEHPLPKVA